MHRASAPGHYFFYDTVLPSDTLLPKIGCWQFGAISDVSTELCQGCVLWSRDLSGKSTEDRMWLGGTAVKDPP